MITGTVTAIAFGLAYVLVADRFYDATIREFIHRHLVERRRSVWLVFPVSLALHMVWPLHLLWCRMSWLGWLNLLLIQWSGWRLGRIMDGEHTVRYAWIGPVWPMTGWWASNPYRWIGR